MHHLSRLLYLRKKLLVPACVNLDHHVGRLYDRFDFPQTYLRQTNPVLNLLATQRPAVPLLRQFPQLPSPLP
jgi:hypothetical protein